MVAVATSRVMRSRNPKSPARTAAPCTPASPASSVRRRARRCTSASTAASPSTILNVIKMSKFHPLTVATVKHETRDAIAVTFDVPPELKAAFQYQQGQHLTLRAMIDGEDVRRSYSICSAVQDERLRVAIKRVPG